MLRSCLGYRIYKELRNTSIHQKWQSPLAREGDEAHTSRNLSTTHPFSRRPDLFYDNQCTSDLGVKAAIDQHIAPLKSVL